MSFCATTQTFFLNNRQFITCSTKQRILFHWKVPKSKFGRGTRSSKPKYKDQKNIKTKSMTALSADQRTESTRPQRPQPEELALKTTSSFSSVGASMVVGGGTAPATATAVALEEGVVPSPTILRRRSTTRQAAASVTTDATRRMICGGLAGMIAKTATNPLERIKMLSQTGEHSMSTTASSSAAAPTHHRPTIIGLYRDILRNEGIWGLWAGNGANLIRVFPSKAIVFSSNDLYKHFFEGCVPSKDHRETYAGPISFVAGGMAGMTASACTYPLDLTRGRISGKLGVNGRKMYGGIWQTMALTIKDEGFFALYKGVTPTLMVRLPSHCLCALW